jgi:hypothetical protein
VAQIIPIGYVTIREAAEVIAQSRFAGVADRPEVTKLRRLGVDAADGAAIDDAVAALWKAADAGKLRVVAIGGKPRKIVRLDPEDLKEVPFLRSPRGRDFNLLRPRHRLYKQITQWFIGSHGDYHCVSRKRGGEARTLGCPSAAKGHQIGWCQEKSWSTRASSRGG